MADIDQLSINISASTTQASNAIDKLVSRLDQLGKSLGRLSTGHFDAQINGAANALLNLGAAAEMLSNNNITNAAKSLERLATAGQSLTSAREGASAIEGIANAMQTLQGAADLPDFSGIAQLASALGKVGGDKAMNASFILPQIASALHSFEGLVIPDVTGLAELSAVLRKFGSTKDASAAQALPFIADGLRQFNDIHIADVSSVAELATALASLGKAAVKNAADNIPAIATAFRTLIAELSNLPAVSRQTVELANALGQLAQGSRGVNTLLNGQMQRGFSSYSAAAGRARISTLSLASAVAKLRAIFFALRRVFGFLKDAIEYSSSLTEVQNVVDVTFGRNAEKMEQLTQSSIQTLGMNALTAKQIGSRFQAMGSAMGITQTQVGEASEFLADKVHSSYGSIYNDMSDVSIQLTKLAADMASFYNVEQADVAKDLEAVFTGMTRPLRKYGKNLAA